MYLELFREGVGCMILLAAILLFAYVAWVDSKTMEIPDRCHLILLGLAGLQMLIDPAIPLVDRGFGLIAISLPMLFANVVREESFGGGDIKMCSATGFLLGASQMIFGALLALMLAGLYGGFTLVLKIKKPQDSFALGPFLSLGYVTSILIGLLKNGV